MSIFQGMIIKNIIFIIDLVSSTNPLTEKIRFNPLRGLILLGLKDIALSEKLIDPATKNCVRITAAKIGKAKIAAPPKTRPNAASELNTRSTPKLSE